MRSSLVCFSSSGSAQFTEIGSPMLMGGTSSTLAHAPGLSPTSSVWQGGWGMSEWMRARSLLLTDLSNHFKKEKQPKN